MHYFIKRSKLLFLRLSLPLKVFFFLMWTSFNVFTEFVTKLLVYAFFFGHEVPGILAP